MIARVIVLALLISASAAMAEVRANDGPAALRAVLAFYAGEVRLPHRLPAGRDICVEARRSNAPFEGALEGYRRSVRFELAQSSNLAERNASVGRVDELARNRMWMAGPVPRDEATRAIVDAAYGLASRPARKDGPEKIDQRWLSGKQRLGSTGDCVETLKLSRPAVAGDLAFVDVDHQCGMLCGLSATLLLRRQADGSWQVDGGDVHTIS